MCKRKRPRFRLINGPGGVRDSRFASRGGGWPAVRVRGLTGGVGRVLALVGG
jgi:hypothetical protein